MRDMDMGMDMGMDKVWESRLGKVVQHEAYRIEAGQEYILRCKREIIEVG